MLLLVHLIDEKGLSGEKELGFRVVDSTRQNALLGGMIQIASPDLDRVSRTDIDPDELDVDSVDDV